MEVQYEVPVIVEGRPEKYKTDRLVLASVPVDVDIEECSRAELTPAVSVRFEMNSATRCDFKSYGGRLYLPLEPLVMLKRTIRLFDQQRVPFVFKRSSYFVEREAEKGASRPRVSLYPVVNRVPVQYDRPVNPTPLADMAFENLDVQSLERQIASFRDRASRLLICEDMIHVEVSEPCISVRRSINDGDVYLVRPLHRPWQGLSRDHFFPDALFRIDESDRARDFCLSLGSKNEPLLNFHKFLVEIHDPDVLKLSSERASCYAFAHNVLRHDEFAARDNRGNLDEISAFMGNFNEMSAPDRLCDGILSLHDLHSSGLPILYPDEAVIGRAVAEMWDGREINPVSTALFQNGGRRP
ncbi:hypothetical protein [Rhizobium sp. BK176]|uniref:hypothetical protein n=1 Tax=Rhizobium sp. BK176 TaxID=2587071 RepID=UPI0021674582|nr:hypothetical protein [Rhizobium sp. BK176]MCS4089047.1 hypothetical protein [Rhizobium sp. BK176]